MIAQLGVGRVHCLMLYEEKFKRDPGDGQYRKRTKVRFAICVSDGGSEKEEWI